MARHKQPDDDNYILGSWEAAKYLSIGINNVRALVRNGIIPIYRVNSRVWLFNKSVLDQYRADREVRKEFVADVAVKRREVSINVADVTLSEDVKAFSRLYGRGIVELWALVVAYALPRTGSITVPIDTLTYRAGLTLEYVSKCFEFWKAYQWIRPDYEIGRLNVTARLTDPTGAIPANNIPTLSNDETDEMGDDGLGTMVEGKPVQLEPELTLLTANEAEFVNNGDDAAVLSMPAPAQKPTSTVEMFGEPFVPPMMAVAVADSSTAGKKKPGRKPLSDAASFKPGQYKPTESEIREVFAYWQEVCGHKEAKLDGTRRTRITWALSTYGSIERCKMAINGIASNPHNQGQNDRNRKYDDIELCFRNAVKFEGFEMDGRKAKTAIDCETGEVSVSITDGEMTPAEKIAKYTQWAMEANAHYEQQAIERYGNSNG